MSIPYEQSWSPWNTTPKLPNMRLPSYKSLHRKRHHPYGAVRSLSSFIPTETMELVEDADFEDDLANPIHIPFSLPTILEDDCMAGLRTVVSESLGKDSAKIGYIHLVIDFALIVRQHIRKSGAAVGTDVA